MENNGLRNSIETAGKEVKRLKDLEDGGEGFPLAELMGGVLSGKIISSALKDPEQGRTLLNEYRNSRILKDDLSTNLRILAEMIDFNSEPVNSKAERNLQALDFDLERNSIGSEDFKRILEEVVRKNKPGPSNGTFIPSYNAATQATREETGGYEGYEG